MSLRPRRERPRPRRRRKGPRSRADRPGRGAEDHEAVRDRAVAVNKGGTMFHRLGFVGLSLSIVALAVFAFGPSTSVVMNADIAHAQGVVAKGNLKYTGNASCGASSCHGSTKPKPEYPRMNENIIWSTKDKHNKAFATLTNEKLKSGVSPSKIAKNMSIADATKSD